MSVLKFLLTLGIGLVACTAPFVFAQEDAVAPTEQSEDTIDYKTLENPLPHTAKSIARGKLVYTRYCQECHGPDGKAEVDLIADATNLTQPKLWRNGTTEGEIFKAIKEGAGVAMPPFKLQIRNDDDMWHMVNFIQSLWPADLKPEIEPEPEEEAPDSSESE